MSVEWRIYYSNFTTFDSTQGKPEDAPSFGVICIVFPDDIVGRQIMHRWDWYYYHSVDCKWWGCDLTGLLDVLLHNLPFSALKQGRNVSNQDYAIIMGMADKDPDFPPRSGSVPIEQSGLSARKV